MSTKSWSIDDPYYRRRRTTARGYNRCSWVSKSLRRQRRSPVVPSENELKLRMGLTGMKKYQTRSPKAILYMCVKAQAHRHHADFKLYKSVRSKIFFHNHWFRRSLTQHLCCMAENSGNPSGSSSLKRKRQAAAEERGFSANTHPASTNPRSVEERSTSPKDTGMMTADEDMRDL